MALGAWHSWAEANSEALLLRKFRYLVRAQPGIDFAMDKLLASYSFRTRLVLNSLGDWSVLLTAKPTILGDIISLNPDLGPTFPD